MVAKKRKQRGTKASADSSENPLKEALISRTKTGKARETALFQVEKAKAGIERAKTAGAKAKAKQKLAQAQATYKSANSEARAAARRASALERFDRAQSKAYAKGLAVLEKKLNKVEALEAKKAAKAKRKPRKKRVSE